MSSAIPSTQGDFADFFIQPNVDLTKGHDDLVWAATLERGRLIERWQTSKGKEILSKWKSEHYSRKSLDALVGKYYGLESGNYRSNFSPLLLPHEQAATYPEH